MSQAEEADPFKEFTTEAFENGAPKVADQPEQKEEKLAKEADKPEETAEETEETAESEEKEEAKEPAKETPKPKKTVEQRIGDLTRARREAERERDDLKQRLAALERGDTSQRKPDLTDDKKPASGAAKGEPKPEDYDLGELDKDYIADLVDFKADQRIAAREAALEEKRQRDAAAQQAQEFANSVKQTYAKGAEKYDDFVELVVEGAENGDWDCSETIAKLAIESDVGADILHHLASDPDEAAKVYRLPAHKQAAYFGRLEAQYSAPAEKNEPEKSNAPKLQPPVKQPRGAGGQFTVAPDTNDFAAFEAMANKQLTKSG